MAPDVRQIDEAVDRPQQVGGRNVPLKREFVEQRRLIDLPLTHHRFKSPAHKADIRETPTSVKCRKAEIRQNAEVS